MTDLTPIEAGSLSLETCNSIAEFDNIKVTALQDSSILFEENFDAYPDYIFPELPEETEDIVYDENGNMVKIKNKAITYDYDNRPETIETITETETITNTFYYDYSGQRVFKEVTGSTQTITTQYLGNLYEVQGNNEKQTKYIYANGQKVASVVTTQTQKKGEKIFKKLPKKIEKKGKADIQQTVYYFHNDHLSGSNVVTDSGGNQVQLIEYLPFGETKKNEGTYNTAYKFTGKELDAETGLYYYGARYYSPELGRFISPDTIVQAPYDPQSLNRYAYCRNNPLILVDPSGHSWLSEWWGKSGSAEWWNENRYYVATATIMIVTGGTLGWGSAAFIGEVSGAASGYIGAERAEGDIGKGMFVGAVVGGISGAAAKALPVAKGGTISGTYNVSTKATTFKMSSDLMLKVGARLAGQGAIMGGGMGGIRAYAGGKGSTSEIIRGIYQGAAIGATTNIAMFGTTYALNKWQIAELNLESLALKGSANITYSQETGWQANAFMEEFSSDISSNIGAAKIFNASVKGALTTSFSQNIVYATLTDITLSVDIGLSTIIGGFIE